MTYNEAINAVKVDLIETATEMGLDVEWYKSEILNDEYFKTHGIPLLATAINEKINS